MAQAPMTPELFWSKVEKTDACWLWRGTIHHLGYGVVSVKGKQQRAHRAAWMWAVGEIPIGLIVRHRCDDPICVRPDHLLLGTHADNSADMVDRGRQARGERHASRLHPEMLHRGDAHWARKHPEWVKRGSARSSAKLTEPQVAEIRRRVITECGTPKLTKRLAAEYGVSKSLMEYIINGTYWKHVKAEAA